MVGINAPSFPGDPRNAIFVPDPEEWNRAFKTWHGTLGVGLRAKAELLEATAALEAPRPGRPPRNRTGINYATGRLASAIYTLYEHSIAGGELESRLIVNVPHAAFVHGGTHPHMIYPNTAPALAFFWPRAGRVVHLLHVLHPGTLKNDFLDRAVNKVW